MAEIALKGNMKVKTLKNEFKKAFGSTLRVYKSITCKGAFADDEATLASIRAKDAKGGELAVGGNMQVGNFEKKVAEMYGIEQKRTAAIGDYFNDFEMLKEVAFPACCGQAPKEMKKISKFIACHCNHGAVADLIEYMVINFAE